MSGHSLSLEAFFERPFAWRSALNAFFPRAEAGIQTNLDFLDWMARSGEEILDARERITSPLRFSKREIEELKEVHAAVDIALRNQRTFEADLLKRLHVVPYILRYVASYYEDHALELHRQSMHLHKVDQSDFHTFSELVRGRKTAELLPYFRAAIAETNLRDAHEKIIEKRLAAEIARLEKKGPITRTSFFGPAFGTPVFLGGGTLNPRKLAAEAKRDSETSEIIGLAASWLDRLLEWRMASGATTKLPDPEPSASRQGSSNVVEFRSSRSRPKGPKID